MSYYHRRTGWLRQGALATSKKNKKRTFSGKTLTQFEQKEIARILFLYNLFLWVIILIIPEMNITDISSLISWSLFLIEKDSWPCQLQ